jgi:hypothetical protein
MVDVKSQLSRTLTGYSEVHMPCFITSEMALTAVPMHSSLTRNYPYWRLRAAAELFVEEIQALWRLSGLIRFR